MDSGIVIPPPGCNIDLFNLVTEHDYYSYIQNKNVSSKSYYRPKPIGGIYSILSDAHGKVLGYRFCPNNTGSMTKFFLKRDL